MNESILAGAPPAPALPRSRRRALTAAVVITGLFVVLCQFIPLKDASDRLDAFPLTGQAFASREIPADPVELPVIGEARMMKRLCQTGSQRFVISVIDGTRNRHAVHDPAYCFRGAGWEVTSSEPLSIPGGDGAKLKLTKDGKTTEAVYWFSNGSERHASAMSSWFSAASRRLTFGQSGPAPVLVLLFSPDATPLEWSQIWKDVPELWWL